MEIKNKNIFLYWFYIYIYTMKKIIDIPDDFIIPLKVMAAYENKPVSIFMRDMIIRIINEQKIKNGEPTS